MKRLVLLCIAVFIVVGVLIGGGVFLKFVREFAPHVRTSVPAKDIRASTTPQTRIDALGLTVPEGFTATIFAKDLVNPRVIAYDPTGTMLVSVPSEGTILALPDSDGDGEADERVIILSGLNKPHGITFRCAESRDVTGECLRHDFYVAETHRVGEYHYDPRTRRATFRRTIAELPGGGDHVSRTIQFRPFPNESELLISVGSSCNVCVEEDTRRAAVLAVNVSENDVPKIYARGLRNSVFLELHPVTGDMWATEMGRDLLGDDTPPDEINIIEEGSFYGWPTCYGKNVHDVDFDKNTYIRNPCMEPFETGSHIDIPAHSAPLGIAFIPEEGWPEDWWYDAIVAYHGSWNRSEPTGYKLVRIDLDSEGNVVGPTTDFVTGWYTVDGDVIGRPVDVKLLPGGTMYVSDDRAGVIYMMRRLP